MKILETLKKVALDHLAKTELPSSLERGMLADKIAYRIVPFGEKITLDHDAAERFAQNCIDETIRLLQDKIERGR